MNSGKSRGVKTGHRAGPQNRRSEPVALQKTVDMPTGKTLLKNLPKPMVAYLLLIAGIVLSKQLAEHLGFDSALTAAGLMFCIPSILDRENTDSLRFNLRGFSTGVAVSAVVLFAYVSFLQILGLSMERTVVFTEPSIFLMLTHLVVYALPEEFFFRGYLQKKMGGGWRAVVITSILFAAAHFIVICIFSGGRNCMQNLLTFFPSTVMGYIYMRTGTLWSSVFFHFAANIVYISVRMV